MTILPRICQNPVLKIFNFLSSDHMKFLGFLFLRRTRVLEQGLKSDVNRISVHITFLFTSGIIITLLRSTSVRSSYYLGAPRCT